MAEALTRRDRLRAEAVAEIKDRAWTQLAATGPLALSLRAIAREMGVTSSALYRYFPSREALLAALTSDGFASLADALEAADEAARAKPRPPGELWLCVAGAYRRWALDHPTAYSLIYGTPCEDGKEGRPEVIAELRRGVDVLFGVMLDGVRSGELHPARHAGQLTDAMRHRLQLWLAELDISLDESALAACLLAWSTLHGTLALELFEQLPPVLLPADALFDQNMRLVLGMLGCAGYD